MTQAIHAINETAIASAAEAVIRSASLTNTTGTRDAEYHCQIVGLGDDQYNVNFQYGRRGTTLRPGCKTAKPVPLAAAEKVFNKLVAEKKADGYLDANAASVTPFVQSDPTEQFQRPQLLNDIQRDEALALLEDDRYAMQPKMDGKRIQVHVTRNGSPKVSNKLGKACAVPAELVQQIRTLQEEVMFLPLDLEAVHLDGELIGNWYHVFDILQIGDRDLRVLPFEEREDIYQRLIRENKQRADGGEAYVDLYAVPTYVTTADKTAAFARIEAIKGEGVVFKLKTALHTEGRPNSGGPALKFKFKERSTCICLGDTDGGRRSTRLGLLDATGAMVHVGNVSVKPCQDMPQPGDLLEVEYLYRYEGGSLFQPVLLGVRDDVLRRECTTAQVKRVKQKLADSDEE